jgi:hypothetical protein
MLFEWASTMRTEIGAIEKKKAIANRHRRRGTSAAETFVVCRFEPKSATNSDANKKELNQALTNKIKYG